MFHFVNLNIIFSLLRLVFCTAFFVPIKIEEKSWKLVFFFTKDKEILRALNKFKIKEEYCLEQIVLEFFKSVVFSNI